MVMEILRNIPHPTYGNCGGASKRCTISKEKPVDAMDTLFQKHDKVMYMTAKQRQLADKMLANGLRRLNPKKLSLYGRIYRCLAMIIFR